MEYVFFALFEFIFLFIFIQDVVLKPWTLSGSLYIEMDRNAGLVHKTKFLGTTYSPLQKL